VSTESRAPQKPLKARRKAARKRMTAILWSILALVIASVFYVIWLPDVRVHAITVTGPDADAAQATAWHSVDGTYGFVLPKNSIFFVPTEDIRQQILAANPDIVAVSVHTSGLTTITIETLPRSTAFLWCGTSIDTPTAYGNCYAADAEGLVFAPVSSATTHDVHGSSTDLRVFSTLDTELAPEASPIRSHVVAASRIPDALRFVKAVRGLGVPVSSLAIHEDEADLWLNGPTRVTYVLGHEEQAAQLAAAAFPTLNLTNGSIQYVDLRFEGKVYLKRYGE
jgi:hypothetical protein